MPLKRPSSDDLVTTSDLNTKTTKDNTSTSTIAEVAGVIMEQELKPPPIDETTTMDFEVTQTTATTDSTAGKREGNVYVAVDGKMRRIMKINVNSGNEISDIQEKIKAKGRNTFASCDAFQIDLFQSEVQAESESINATTGTEATLIAFETPMNTFEKWNAEVTWGTKKRPLIVYTPEAINSGECIHDYSV